ncbi:MAG: ABC transporter permease [Clostridia bacterium]|nr:ABC transporter permease [Clostridia bacterium]
MVNLLIGILTEGLIYSIMAFGVYISLKILDFPDLSTDGTFPLGMAIATFCLIHGMNPYLCLLLAFLAGCCAGAVTGILNIKLRFKDLLCGIITMTALYSINYTIVGKPNEFLSLDTKTVFSIIGTESALYPYRYLIVSAGLAIVAKILLDLYLSTKSGFLLKAAGDNENLIVTLAKNPGTVKILGLSIANGLIAVSGCIYLQYIKSFNVSAGTGSLVIGLAAVIIGTTLFGKFRRIKPTFGVIIGMVIYKACISVAMLLGLQSKDTNLVVSLLFVATLVISNRKNIIKGEV